MAAINLPGEMVDLPQSKLMFCLILMDTISNMDTICKLLELINMDTIFKLLGLINTAILTYFAFQQRNTAKNKLKFDLFKSRYDVYDKTRNCISQCINSTPTQSVAEEILALKHQSKWLFGDEIEDYLDQLYKTMMDMMTQGRQPFSPRNPIIVMKKKLDTKFGEFLKLCH